eukprot:2765751-Pyramimonas_sp.AAC.2
MGASWGPLGAFLGPSLGPLGAVLGPSRAPEPPPRAQEGPQSDWISGVAEIQSGGPGGPRQLFLLESAKAQGVRRHPARHCAIERGNGAASALPQHRER